VGLQERNKRALELLLQKDNTIQQLRKDLETAEKVVVKQQLEKEAAQASASAARWRAEQLEKQSMETKQQHADELVRSQPWCDLFALLAEHAEDADESYPMCSCKCKSGKALDARCT
jgi:hypothetical protein